MLPFPYKSFSCLELSFAYLFTRVRYLLETLCAEGNGRVWTGLDVYHIMDIRLTTMLSPNPEDSSALTKLARFFLFSFVHINLVRTPFLAFHDTTVSPTVSWSP
jgi:hypothetical protein